MKSHLRTSPPGRTSFFGIIWPILLLTTFAVSCAETTPEKINERSLPDDFVQGSFIVSATSSTNEKDLESLSQKLGKDLSCEVKTPNRIRWSETGVVSQELHNTFHIKFENCDLTKENTQNILAELAGESSIIAAEAEAVAKASPILENDPYKDTQGHLDFIRRDQACEITKDSAKTIVVAVIDSGVDKDHEDLVDNFYRDQFGNVVGANFVGRGSSMPPDQDWDDGSNHGTHVAGLIAATAANNTGGVGVASCANVKIMPVRVLNDEGRGSSIEIERGVKWAIDNGAQIVNLSLGFTSRSVSRPSFYRSVYADAARRNVVVLAAAGNDGYVNGTAEESSTSNRWHFPSSYDNVISVAATNNFGTLTSFSNRGERVDIAAPGYRVLSTVPGSYSRMSGTSMATPVAAGAYAMALASIADHIDTDRIDVSVAESLLDNATLLGEWLPSGDVLAGGVIDTEALVSAMNNRFPAPVEDEPVDEPTDNDPWNFDQPDEDEPTDDTPADEPSDDEPSDDQPSDEPSEGEPTDDEPVDTPDRSFQFVGLEDGDRAGWPQKILVEGVPAGTHAVYLYWGYSLWSFSKIYTNGNVEGALEDGDSWYLYGDRTLRAYAVDANYKVLGYTAIELSGW